ncbi:hypothetical protein CA983_29585 [Streptomyces swartbergensis]|uniref:Uncharacterized protein n=1 Tax=Streptomyces swartbergensis TaxID=487165 RepID=A0A243RTA3_9ACTN|nr:hypothetical protein CA983_29585 [Streptomyces swartbergensis]
MASAHPSPDTVRREWSGAAKLALIPLGRAFDAVRLADCIVHRAVGSDDSCVARDRLAQYLEDGPVIHDPGFRRYYALVPTGTAETWGTPIAECLGEGTYLGVPRADHAELDAHTQASYWVRPMTRPGHLCRPADVLALVMMGGRVDDEDES